MKKPQSVAVAVVVTKFNFVCSIFYTYLWNSLSICLYLKE